MASKKSKKLRFTFSVTRFIVFLIISALICSTLFFADKIENKINSYLNTTMAETADFTQALDKDFVVHFVDVGQGDCIMLELPDGTKGIIDGGDNKSDSEEHIVEYAKSFIFDDTEDETFDFMIATHADADHIGGLDVVLKNFQVNKVYRPKTFYINEKDNATAEQLAFTEQETALAAGQGFTTITNNNKKDTAVLYNFLSLAYSEPNCEVVFTEDKMEIKDDTTGYLLRFYGPIKDTYSDINNYSPVIICEYQGFSIALTGDAETQAEEDILAAYPDLPNVDAMKLGHHGSGTSTTQAFLETLDPEYVFICVGEGNKYNHPHEAVLERLKNYGITDNIYRTDLLGDILFAIGETSTSSETAVNADTSSAKTYGIFIANSENSTEVVPTVFHWWYVVVGAVVIVFFICFLTTKELKKIAKNKAKTYIKN